MAKAITPKKKPKAKKKRPGGSRPKKQQATSAQRIMREKYKALAAQYRIANFPLQAIADAINEHYTTGEGADELPAGFKFRPISRHLVHDLIVESIKESVDPLLKDELRELHLQQHNALLAAVMTPALQGSIAHVASAQSLLRDIAKLTGVNDDDDDGGGGGASVVQYFINGNLARVV